MAPQRRIRFDAIGEAFNMVKDNAGAWIVATLIFMVIVYAVAFIVQLLMGGVIGSASRGGNGTPNFGPLIGVGLVSQIVQIAVTTFFMGGFVRMAIKQARGQAIQIGDLFSGGDVVGPLIGATLLTALCADIGFLLCIIPGFLVAGLLMFTSPLVVDQKMGAIDAMKTSWEALKGDMLNAVGFLFVVGLIAGLGALACGVGVLFTVPVAQVALAIAYRDFFGGGNYGVEPSINMPLPPQSPNQPPQFPDDDRTIPMR